MNLSDNFTYLKVAVIVDILLEANPKICSPEIWKIVSPLRQNLLLKGNGKLFIPQNVFVSV
jgi:hypothetical protein